jgi:2-C-methyl-D-erythritol 2,4-cyclodiphosphate synthase
MQNRAPRIGHGYDIHRLQSGGKLVLGGVIVSTDISPIAHSDGDVAIHALVDALLGAIGRGDIGQMFPPSDPKWKDADSGIFLKAAMEEVRRAGYSIGNADLTVLAERPRLAPFRDEIRAALSKLLECDPSNVNLKAGTNENCDAIGRGEAIAAHAVVILLTLA